ncbi:hypothetical protein IQ13_1307 [Lacibacter cauensis]|uniref:Uncharacterized protein n=1 Tax=Lacibacter cauensis TaxID=510947 RepID=A0A562SPJ0_9BACT|nr:hypothetical protein IQ13_1307 [Lacibacter cauensis]
MNPVKLIQFFILLIINFLIVAGVNFLVAKTMAKSGEVTFYSILPKSLLLAVFMTILFTLFNRKKDE